MQFNNNKPVNLRIVKLIMQETGTYNPQYSRPYTTQFDGQTLNAVVERVVDRNMGKFDQAALSGLSSSFISPTPTPEAMIPIVNGWNEKRARFLMEVNFDFQLGGSSTSYIQGYTSFPGITASQSIASDMEFYINSIITTKKTSYQTPYGMQVAETVTDNSHLLCSNNWNSISQPGQQRLMRPQDVFCNMQTSHIPGSYGGDITDIMDGRTILRSEATKSSRINGLGGAYASKIIDGYLTSSSLSDFGQSESAIISNSISQVHELQAMTDPFLAALASVTSYGVTNKFRYTDLTRLDPNVQYVTNYAIAGPTQMLQPHYAGQTAAWHSTDRATLAATILSQAVPAIMMDLMINRMVFKSTNHDITGQMNTVIIDGKSFSNTDMTRNFEMFKRRLEKEVLLDLTYNNQISYAIDMRVDLLGETWIGISIDGQPTIDYVTPSFCDNLFVPVITNSAATVQTLTHDFENLVGYIKDAGSTMKAPTALGGLV